MQHFACNFRHIDIMKHISLLPLLALLSSLCSAQGLQIYGLMSDDIPGSPQARWTLVELNPYNADTSTLYTIPSLYGIKASSSTFDHANRSYLFLGIDGPNGNRFYSVSVDSSQVNNPTIQGDPPHELQYDLQDEVTYGLQSAGPNDPFSLLKVDLQTGQTYDKTPLPGVRGINAFSSGFNSNTHRYVFSGYDQSLTRRLYYVNAQTGQIISQPTLADNHYYRGLRFDLNTNILYALLAKPDSSLSQNQGGGNVIYGWNVHLVQVDTLTGGYTNVNNTPLLSGFDAGTVGGSLCFDQASQTYMLIGTEAVGSFRLMLINVNSGLVYSDVPIFHNVHGLECDNQGFAQHAYAKASAPIELEAGTDMLVYPNPTTALTTLTFPSVVNLSEIRVLDNTGRVIWKERRETETRTLDLELGRLPTGMYIIQAKTRENRSFSQRLLISQP